MANTNLDATNVVTHENTSPIQSKEYVDKTLRATLEANEFWSKFTQHKPWQKGSSVLSYRRLTRPTVTTAEPLAEGIAPVPTKIAYTEYRVTTENYREKVVYTKDSEIFNYDDSVADATDTLGYLFTKKQDIIKGTPFISSKAVLTAKSTVIATMRAAKMALKKNKMPTWDNGNYLMICTPEVIDQLEDELSAKGAALDEVTKSEVLNCNVRRKYGFDIIEAENPDILYLTGDNAGKHMIVFMGKNLEGKSPVTDYLYGSVETFFNPLGTEIVEDANGKLTSDGNHQQGSVAMNAWGQAAVVNEDLAIIDCPFTIATDAGVTLADSGRTGYYR